MTFSSSRDISRLIEIMAALRTPGSGCPWDLEQNFSTIAPYTIEEAYETADAIARGDLDDLRDELGDLLLQVVFHARMAEEQSAFDFGGVVEAITEKLLRRHPHVFGDTRHLSPDEVKGLWDRIKAQEKAERAARGKPDRDGNGALAGVPAGLPSLARALKLQQKAGMVGFDWNDPKAVLAKIREETDEIAAEIESGDTAKAESEIGDLLFAVVNLARHLDVDPDSALRGTNLKFERRFAAIERALGAKGRLPQDATLAELDALWDAAKEDEQSGER
jgi:nucleoside triphosphate diphosphatase